MNKPNHENITYYKSYINMYNKLKRAMKTNYYRDKLELNKNNMKQTWSTLKEAIGKQNNKLNFSQSFNIDNKNVSNRSEIAEQFNKYFSKIGASTANNVHKTSKKYTDYIQNPSLNNMLLEQIDQQHIIDAANELKPKSISGHDDISTKLMKETIQNIILPITHISNNKDHLPVEFSLIK